MTYNKTRKVKLQVMLFNCDTVVRVLVDCGGWCVTRRFDVNKPLPAKYAGDPLILDAYRQGQVSVQRWRDKCTRRGSDGTGLDSPQASDEPQKSAGVTSLEGANLQDTKIG